MQQISGPNFPGTPNINPRSLTSRAVAGALGLCMLATGGCGAAGPNSADGTGQPGVYTDSNGNVISSNGDVVINGNGSIQTDGCRFKIGGDAPDRPTVTGEQRSFDAANLNISGLIADTTVRVEEGDKTSYRVTAPAELLGLVTSSEVSTPEGEALDLRFSCPKEEVAIRQPIRVEVSLPRGGAVSIYNALGNTVIGDTEGLLRVNTGGSGDMTIGDVLSADITASGSSKHKLGAVRGDFSAKLSGSSNLSVGRLDGQAAEAHAEGSSHIQISDGDIKTFYAAASGSGDISFGGQVDRATLVASGASSISVEKTGTHTQDESGAGKITVG